MPSPVDSSLTLTSKAAHAAPGARVKRLAPRWLAAGEGKQPPRLDRVVEGPRYHGEGRPEQSAILPTQLRGAFVAHAETRLCCIDMLAQHEASCLLEAKALLVLERGKRGHLLEAAIERLDLYLIHQSYGDVHGALRRREARHLQERATSLHRREARQEHRAGDLALAPSAGRRRDSEVGSQGAH